VSGYTQPAAGMDVCLDGAVTGAEICTAQITRVNMCYNIMVQELDGSIHTVRVCNLDDAFEPGGHGICRPGDSGGPAFEKFGDYRSAMGIISACFIPVGQNFGSRVLFSDIVQVRSIMGGNVAVW